MYTLLKEHANSLSKKAVDFAAELVRTPSVSLCESHVAKLVERKMNELGYDKVLTDDFGNVFGIIYGIEKNPTVLLTSHMDTVMASEDPGWELSPYSGEINDGRIYGLGAADCKAGLSMQIYAGYLLKQALLPLRGTLIVAATVSEENGLSLGIQHLISKTLADMKIKVDYAILGEPTDLNLFYGHDGWVEYKIGMDAPNPNFLRDTANAVFQNLLEASGTKGVPGLVELMSVGEPQFDSSNGKAHAHIIFNRRLFKDENADAIVDKIRDYSLQNLPWQAASVNRGGDDFNLDIKIREESQKLQSGEKVQVRYLSKAWETDPFSPLMDRARQALTSAGCKSQPGKWRLPRLGMGTAGSVLTKKLGIPTIGYGPGKENVAHTINEYVDVQNISEGILGTASIVHSLAGVPVFGWTSDLEI